MSTSQALILLILFVSFSIIGIGTAFENRPSRTRKSRNDVNSEIVRKAFRKDK